MSRLLCFRRELEGAVTIERRDRAGGEIELDLELHRLLAWVSGHMDSNAPSPQELPPFRKLQ
jgi:hypothetical protein